LNAMMWACPGIKVTTIFIVPKSLNPWAKVRPIGKSLRNWLIALGLWTRV
jgi:hypothetical protein